ncbi:porin [Aquabacterium sp. A7-Y]|uniref:porin n=1 Tax=Aquabacterium sp. A7-Y TaxID=1349605 RepID=UPI00223D9353|nr:porin [Aquabacterium sp. A7-Y]MCW7539875.1 porin [Aquabacterium sp. A7-Y]
MKKSLLALAVLGAFAGAASAQSAVTIYGKIDMGLAKANDGESILTGGPSNDKLQVREQAGSRLGFRGTEDLGGGLKANFQIEHRFQPDGGNITSAASFWDGMSWVGLSGAFGELRLGRDYSPYFWTNIAADPWGYDTVAQAGMLHTSAGIAVSRYGNMISYRTPDMGGLTAQAAIGLAEKDDTEHNIGFNVQYKGGPLYAGFGYHRGGAATGFTGMLLSLNPGMTTSSPTYGPALAELGLDDDHTASSFGFTVSYDLGVAKLIGSVAQSKTETALEDTEDAKARNFLFAVSAPLGGGDLRGVVTQLRGKDGLDGLRITKFGLGYHYPLSKRTKVYADVGSAKTKFDDESLKRRTAFDLGIQHNF